MNLTEVSRLYVLFTERYGVSPNTLIVDAPTEITHFIGMVVRVDETSPKPYQVALILEV